MCTKLIKFPLLKLTKEEYKEYKEYCKEYPEGPTYVYYTTELSLGVGYDIVCTKTKVKHKDNIVDFGDLARNITDIDELLDNF